MRLFFCITILFSFLSQAQTPTVADFSGKWTGTAILTTKKGDKTACDSVTLNVHQMATQVSFGELSYLCGQIQFTFTPPTMQIQAGQVFYKNKYNNLVGTVTDQEAQLTFIINDQNGRDRYTVKKLSDITIDYLYEAIDVDQTTGQDVEMSVHGQLTKVQ